jgi:hypothetical protein
MYSDLKVTVGVTWDTAATATPVADMFAVKLIGKARYGVNYNRVTMSTTAFRYMIATTEFQNKARHDLAPNVSYANLTLTDLEGQRASRRTCSGCRSSWTTGATGRRTPSASPPARPLAGARRRAERQQS